MNDVFVMFIRENKMSRIEVFTNVEDAGVEIYKYCAVRIGDDAKKTGLIEQTKVINKYMRECIQKGIDFSYGVERRTIGVNSKSAVF